MAAAIRPQPEPKPETANDRPQGRVGDPLESRLNALIEHVARQLAAEYVRLMEDVSRPPEAPDRATPERS